MGQETTNAVPPSDPESGVPGGGRGRRDPAGGSGVFPASAGHAPPDAVPRTQAEWGQGDRGAAGFDDSGGSGLFYYPAQLPRDDAPGVHAAGDESAGQGRTGDVPHVDEIEARRAMQWGGW